MGVVEQRFFKFGSFLLNLGPQTLQDVQPDPQKMNSWRAQPSECRIKLPYRRPVNAPIV